MDILDKLKEVCHAFDISGDVVSAIPYGEGHINTTYLVTTSRKRYILQKMNERAFKDIDALMKNNSHYLDGIKARNAFTYELTLPYYKSLLNAIASIIAESNNFLICGVLNENQIETLKDWQWEINPIIEHSKESTLELLLDFKTLFFKNIYKYLDVLDFDKNEKPNCYIVEKV